MNYHKFPIDQFVRHPAYIAMMAAAKALQARRSKRARIAYANAFETCVSQCEYRFHVYNRSQPSSSHAAWLFACDDLQEAIERATRATRIHKSGDVIVTHFEPIIEGRNAGIPRQVIDHHIP